MALQRKTVAIPIGSALPKTCPLPPRSVFEDSEGNPNFTRLERSVFLDLSCSYIYLESAFTWYCVALRCSLHVT